MTKLEECATVATRTLRHHGVEMHPDDVRGLVVDILLAIKTPDDAMIEAGKKAGDMACEYSWNATVASPCHSFPAMIAAVTGEPK